MGSPNAFKSNGVAFLLLKSCWHFVFLTVPLELNQQSIHCIYLKKKKERKQKYFCFLEISAIEHCAPKEKAHCELITDPDSGCTTSLNFMALIHGRLLTQRCFQVSES